MAQFPQPWPSRFLIDSDANAPTEPAAQAPGGQAAPVLVSFDPDAVVRAIVFHMLDEGLAREVAEESVGRTAAWLRRRGLRPSIRRTAWELMSNHDRLEWLLSESQIVPLMQPDRDVVMLEARDGR
jgi:hypothetical protein